MATESPPSAQRPAAFSPGGPAPITMTSYSSLTSDPLFLAPGHRRRPLHPTLSSSMGTARNAPSRLPSMDARRGGHYGRGMERRGPRVEGSPEVRERGAAGYPDAPALPPAHHARDPA